jgi:hypothetical protein
MSVRGSVGWLPDLLGMIVIVAVVTGVGLLSAAL